MRRDLERLREVVQALTDSEAGIRDALAEFQASVAPGTAEERLEKIEQLVELAPT